jgi:hypothetical protein
VNTPSRAALDRILSLIGTDSTQLGSGSIGLIAAPFTPGPNLTLAQINEATFGGYLRQSLGSHSPTFTGADGFEYNEIGTFVFQGSSTTTPNTIYGLFLTPGSSSSTLWGSDKFAAPIPINGPASQVTITLRVGLDPNNGNYGMNVISS